MGNKSSPRGTRARMTTEAFSEAGIAGVGSTGLTTQEPDDGRGVVPTLMSVLALIGALFLGQLAIGEVGYRATPCQLSPPAAATCALTCTLTFACMCVRVDVFGQGHGTLKVWLFEEGLLKEGPTLLFQHIVSRVKALVRGSRK